MRWGGGGFPPGFAAQVQFAPQIKEQSVVGVVFVRCLVSPINVVFGDNALQAFGAFAKSRRDLWEALWYLIGVVGTEEISTLQMSTPTPNLLLAVAKITKKSSAPRESQKNVYFYPHFKAYCIAFLGIFQVGKKRSQTPCKHFLVSTGTHPLLPGNYQKC